MRIKNDSGHYDDHHASDYGGNNAEGSNDKAEDGNSYKEGKDEHKWHILGTMWMKAGMVDHRVCFFYSERTEMGVPYQVKKWKESERD